MNRGFRTYYKFAGKEMRTVFKRKGNFIRYYLYSLMALFGKILPFGLPVFMLADVRMARMAIAKKDIVVTKSFASVERPKAYWSMFLSIVITILMFLSGAIIIVGLYFLIQFTMVSIFNSLPDVNYDLFNILSFVILIPFAVIGVVYLIMFPMYLLPTPFILDSLDNASASVALYRSIESMKQKVKRTAFFLMFVPTLIYAIIIALFAVIIIFLTQEYTELNVILAYTFLSLFILIGILLLPLVQLRINISLVALFEDVVLDKINVTKTIDGVNVKVKTYANKDIDITSVEENLISLFDQTEDVQYKEEPIPETIPDEKILVEHEEEVKEENNEVKEEVSESSEEETSVEEQKEEVEETKEIETPIEEVKEEVEETPVEEPIEESTEEPETEVVEETIEEPKVEEVSEVESSEELIETPVEEPVEETIENPTEEITEEVKEEVSESSSEEETTSSEETNVENETEKEK